MDGWDIGLMTLAGYFAVTVMVRMMREHGDATLAQLRQQFEVEQRRLAEERRLEELAERKQQQLEKQQRYLRELEEKKRQTRAA